MTKRAGRWVDGRSAGATGRGMESIARMLANATLFPIRLTLSSGEHVTIPHPDFAHRHPVTKDLIVYPEKGPFLITINPDQIVKIRAKRAAA